jgi:hypothetical protein
MTRLLRVIGTTFFLPDVPDVKIKRATSSGPLKRLCEWSMVAEVWTWSKQRRRGEEGTTGINALPLHRPRP